MSVSNPRRLLPFGRQRRRPQLRRAAVLRRFAWPCAVVLAAASALTLRAQTPPHPQSFTPASLQSGFTQELYGASSQLLFADQGLFGGVAFAGLDPVVAECQFTGTRLHLFDHAATIAHSSGTSLHPETVHAFMDPAPPSYQIQDLLFGGPTPLPRGFGGCGLVNHPNGMIYATLDPSDGHGMPGTGIAEIDPATWTVTRYFGPEASALGIAVDPVSKHLVYVGQDCEQGGTSPTCTLVDLDPDPVNPTPAHVFMQVPSAQMSFVDGLYFDSTGGFVFLAVRSPAVGMQVVAVSGPATLRVGTPVGTPLPTFIPMSSPPDGVAFHAGTSKYVVTNNNDGTISRFDFPGDDYRAAPIESVFASGGFRGDLTQVGPDGCLYLTQSSGYAGPTAADGTLLDPTYGTWGTRYNDGSKTPETSLVRLCEPAGPGFEPGPGVKIKAHLTLVKHVVNDNGGTAVAADFTLSAAGPTTPFSGAGGASGDVDAGTYTLSETGRAGYATSGWTCTGAELTGNSIKLGPGNSATCDITNDDQAAPQLIVIKHVVNDSGGSASAGAWTMNVSGGNPSSAPFPGAEAPGTTITLDAGSYSVTESGGPSGYQQTSAVGCAGTIAWGQTITCTITNDDQPPPLTIACVSPATGQVGVAYSASALASGGVLPYTYAIVGTLPAGLTLNTGTGQISGTPTVTGSFTVKVTDANGAGASTATSACSVTIAPAPLTIACLAPATGQVGVAYSGSALASGGVTPYTYAIVGTLPAGLTLNTGTGQISGTPTVTGSFTVKVTDANGAGASTATSACSVTIAPAPLTIACLAPATGQVGVPYSGSAVASGGVTPYTYAIVGTLPAGLTLNMGTGQISGTPTATGSFTVKVTDSNGAGSTATSACSVTIAPAPLTIACLAPATGQVGVPYSGSAVASGGVLPYTYAIVGTLPAGLTLNTGTGQISGTPTATGSFTVKVTDSNGAGASTATSACSVTIAPAAPALACVAATTGQVGVAYGSSLVASGGVTPYTYSIISGSLPTGLTLNASTGGITGTPTVAGSPAYMAQVVDARGTAAGTTSNSSCGITIAAATPAPTLSCVAATTGQVGVAYSSSLIAAGGVGGYTFSIVAGSLPTGLTLNTSTGAITGTPTAAGSFPFTAKVVDARGTVAGATINSCGITITAAAAAYATYTQGGWGAPPNGNNPGMLLRNNFATVYPAGVTIGGSPYYLKFTSQSAIEAFLPAGGKPGVLNKSATNPTSSSANVFAGQVLALRLSVDFSNAGIITVGLASVKIAAGNPLAGSTVAQVLALANQVIAGNISALPSGISVSTLNDVVSRINQNYDGGTTNNGFLVP